ncbi:MAG: iron-sulfur cluster assembly accessory protein [Candidatus Eisenbacteria bacterium]|nr:iron-sulfur cluster assembly accessory protein [Candidatus Eisenbacteria bacterium]
MITLTPAAVVRLKEVMAREKREAVGLRIAVQGGGCSGMSYVMEFGAEKPGDETFEFGGVRVHVDLKSYLYLNGTELDYVEGLMGAGFKFNNPNVKRSCSCGESFTV